MRPPKRILAAAAATVGLLLVALAAFPLLDVDRYKPRLEAVATTALGMDVHVGGRLRIGLFPSPHLTAEDCRIVDEGDVAVASVKRVRFWIELLPLLRKELRLRRLELRQPWLSIERDPEGRFNVERLRKAVALLGALGRASATLSDGTLLYGDRTSGRRLEATGLQMVVSQLGRAGRGDALSVKSLSLKAELSCREIRTKNLSVTALRISMIAKDGTFQFDPVTMGLLGGQAVGTLRADWSGPVPLYQVHCSLPGFRIEEFLRILSPKKAAVGPMDFSANLAMQGQAISQLVESLAGDMSLRGQDITLEGNDLDERISRFKSSQNFNLVDIGAVFLAGPVGLAVTKGYSFASLFEGSGGSSRIHTVISDWTIERGIASAKDVALATSKNRLALQGRLDFVHGRFADMTVAVIDAKGCASAKQTIRGAFEKPDVDKPRFLKSLAGPAIQLFKKARGSFPGGPCEAFYSGSVPAPN